MKNNTKTEELLPSKTKRGKYEYFSHKDKLTNKDAYTELLFIHKRPQIALFPKRVYDDVTKTNIVEYERKIINPEEELSNIKVSDYFLSNLIEIGAFDSLTYAPSLSQNPLSSLDILENTLSNIKE